jgi:hypothetical protein
MSLRQKVLGFSMLAAWVLLRLAWMPSDPSVSGSFTHDSGYIALVARNLLAGRGYVNDSHWLLFLQPASLPMPFHNANPLYPTLVAGIAGALRVDVAQAGLVISVCSDALLACGVFLLVRRFCTSFGFALAAASFAAVWPVDLRTSFAIAPDALCTACVIWALVVAVRACGAWTWALTGTLLGLAWLARSTALLILPGLFWWIYCQDRRRFPVHMALVLAAAALVASPWLIHTAQVRGSPFASDSGYYWLQEYHAYKAHENLDQFWRGLTPPRALGEILKTEPLEFASFAVKGFPTYAFYLMAGLSGSSRPGAIAFLLALALALWDLRPSVFRSPQFQASALTAIVSVASLAMRPRGPEIRYLAVATTLVAIAVLLPFSSASAGTLPAWGRAVVAACLLIFAVPQQVRMFRDLTPPDPEALAYRRNVLLLRSRIGPRAIVITEAPYTFTYFTGLPAIAPPYPSKTELLQVMRRYGAMYVFLSRDRLDYFYPGAPAALAPELAVDTEIGSTTAPQILFKLTDQEIGGTGDSRRATLDEQGPAESIRAAAPAAKPAR